MQTLPICQVEGLENIAGNDISYTTLDGQRHYLWCEFSHQLKIPPSWRHQYSLKRAYFSDVSPLGLRLLLSEADSIDIIDRFCEYLQEIENADDFTPTTCPSTDDEYSSDSISQ